MSQDKHPAAPGVPGIVTRREVSSPAGREGDPAAGPRLSLGSRLAHVEVSHWAGAVRLGQGEPVLLSSARVLTPATVSLLQAGFPVALDPWLARACTPIPGEPAPQVTDTAVHWQRGWFLHRDRDLPAVITFDGLLTWAQHGYEHRAAGPAEIDYQTQGHPRLVWAWHGAPPAASTRDALDAAWHGQEASRLLDREYPEPYAREWVTAVVSASRETAPFRSYVASAPG